MISNYKEILTKILQEFDEIEFTSSSSFVDRENVLICQRLFSRSANLIENITTNDSYYYREAERIIQGSKRVGRINKYKIKMLKGHLQALLADIEEGLLTNLEYKITALSLLNFFDHARSYL